MEYKNKVLEILAGTHIMSLATLDDGGLWVSNVIFIFDDDLNLYWMSSQSVRHSKALLINKEVAGTVTFSTKSGQMNLGIQFSGLAEKIEGPRFDLAKKHAMKRNKPEPKETDDILLGRAWYKVTPTKIELIDEENFGYSKKEVVIA